MSCLVLWAPAPPSWVFQQNLPDRQHLTSELLRRVPDNIHGLSVVTEDQFMPKLALLPGNNQVTAEVDSQLLRFLLQFLTVGSICWFCRNFSCVNVREETWSIGWSTTEGRTSRPTAASSFVSAGGNSCASASEDEGGPPQNLRNVLAGRHIRTPAGLMKVLIKSRFFRFH